MTIVHMFSLSCRGIQVWMGGRDLLDPEVVRYVQLHCIISLDPHTELMFSQGAKGISGFKGPEGLPGEKVRTSTHTR